MSSQKAHVIAVSYRHIATGVTAFDFAKKLWKTETFTFPKTGGWVIVTAVVLVCCKI